MVNLPPQVALSNYPSAVAVTIGVIATSILLVVVKFFDPTAGVLTLSILIVLGLMGTVAYCLIFTIPPDDITPGVVGALATGFGAVVAYWLGHRGDDRAPPPDKP